MQSVGAGSLWERYQVQILSAVDFFTGSIAHLSLSSYYDPNMTKILLKGT